MEFSVLSRCDSLYHRIRGRIDPGNRKVSQEWMTEYGYFFD